jgi:hypothetical protein
MRKGGIGNENLIGVIKLQLANSISLQKGVTHATPRTTTISEHPATKHSVCDQHK